MQSGSAPTPVTLDTVYAAELNRARDKSETDWQDAVKAENSRGNAAMEKALPQMRGEK